LTAKTGLYNRTQAQLYYEILEAVAQEPFIIAYYDFGPEESLLLYDLSPVTLKFLEVPEEFHAIYLDEVRDRSLLVLLNMSSIRSMSHGSITLMIKCRDSYKRTYAEVNAFPWGVHIALKPRFEWAQVSALPSRVQAIAAWVHQLNKSIKTLVAAVVGLGLSLPSAWIFQARNQAQPPGFVAANPSLNQVEQTEQGKPIEEQVRELLALEVERLMLPRFQSVAFFEYVSNLRSRRYVASYSPTIRERVYRDIAYKNTNEDGWDKILAAHASHRIAVIKREEYASNHAIAILMSAEGAEWMRSYPVYGDGLIGYLRISFPKGLAEDTIPAVDHQMIRLSVLVAHLWQAPP